MIEGPALGIRFDTEKVESAAYGLECWEIFWRAVDPRAIEGARLFDGDTAATLARQESVFLIGVQAEPAVLRSISTSLGKSERFWQMAASPPFVEESVHAEPLVEAGSVLPGGELEGGMWSRSALETMRREGIGLEERPSPCPNCGSEVEAGDRFCMTCSHRLPEAEGAPTTMIAPPVTAAAEPPSSPRRSLLLPLMIGGAALVVLAGGFAVFAGVSRGSGPVADPTSTAQGSPTTRALNTPMAATTSQPVPVLLTADEAESCLAESGLDPGEMDDAGIGDVIGADAVTVVSISPGSTALILTYDSEARAEGAASFFEGSSLNDELAETGRFDNVLVFYETVPSPAIRHAIESCVTGGGPVTVETPPGRTGPVTAARVESCLVDAGLGPITGAGNVITPAQGTVVVVEGAEASAVSISPDGKALIFTYESEAAADDAVSYIMTSGLDDFERSQLDNVVVLYEAVPGPDTREAIEGCATGGGPVTAEASPGTEPSASELAELDTVVGVVLVTRAYTTDEYPAGCESYASALNCNTSPEERIVVLVLEHETGSLTEDEVDRLVDEAFESFLIDGDGFTVDPHVATWHGSGTITEPIEIAYIFITADLPTTLELHWPGHQPVELTP